MNLGAADWEDWLRSQSEPLTYLVFFALFAAMAAAEVVNARSPAPPLRRVRWRTNLALTALFIATTAAVPLSLLAAADLSRAHGMGLLNLIEPPLAPAFVLGFLGRSFISFAVHYLMHRVPVLWRIHRVHHSDPVLDVSTTVRFHPLEPIATAPFGIAGVVAMGIPPAAVMAYEVLDAAINVLSHSNVRWPSWLERSVGLVLVTPDQHRIHHSALRPETDSNFGATLNVWDRLFGTFREKTPLDGAHQHIGLDEIPPADAGSLRWLLRSPLITITPVRPPGETDHAERPRNEGKAAGRGGLADPP